MGGTPLADVMVLCAGLGTRLRPLTEVLPKPMLPIGDRSQLVHILEHLAAEGATRVVVNTHHLPQSFAHAHADGIEVERVFEPDLLGTGGGVANARDRLCAPLVVWNGDILAWPDLGPLRERVRGGGIALLVSPVSVGQPGTLGLGADGHVVRLRGECFGDEVRAANYIGVLALGADALAAVPERGCLVGDLCLPWLRRGGSISTLPYSGRWTDIGTLAEFQAANLSWLEERRLEAYVAPTASVRPTVVLDRSLVHAGADVVGSGVLRRSIVLPRAQATAPAADLVVLESGVWKVSR